MSDKTAIVEVSAFQGKVLVTFADGHLALLDATQIRKLAVRVKALIPLPVDLGGNGRQA
jgi:hypothetical protein